MENEKLVNKYEEKLIHAKNGFAMLGVVVLIILLGIAAFILGILLMARWQLIPLGLTVLIAGCLVMIAGFILCAGFKVLAPNEAVVLTLFGKYHGSLKRDGFHWVNPFCVSLNPGSAHSGITVNDNGLSWTPGGSQKLSLKAMTLNNEKQTVNDERGNPIIIGTIVIWRIVDTTKAVFNVENYKTFLSTQCDSATRNIARMYPYDLLEEDSSNEKTLRGSSQEIAEMLKQDLQERVAMAGLEILEVRITNLTYAPEIAAAMLQRQQAEAVVAARKKIVEGAVGMVEMALEQLSEDEVVQLDDERKAAMVSNLLVILCGNKDVQPVVNSGTIY